MVLCYMRVCLRRLHLPLLMCRLDKGFACGVLVPLAACSMILCNKRCILTLALVVHYENGVLLTSDHQTGWHANKGKAMVQQDFS